MFSCVALSPLSGQKRANTVNIGRVFHQCDFECDVEDLSNEQKLDHICRICMVIPLLKLIREKLKMVKNFLIIVKISYFCLIFKISFLQQHTIKTILKKVFDRGFINNVFILVSSSTVILKYICTA